MSQNTIHLENLDCGNCAAKIEANIQKLEASEEVAVNFMTNNFNAKVKNSRDISSVEEQIKAIVNKYRSDL